METHPDARKKGTWLNYMGKVFKEVAATIDLNLIFYKAVDMEGGTSILGSINRDVVRASDKKLDDPTRKSKEEDTKGKESDLHDRKLLGNCAFDLTGTSDTKSDGVVLEKRVMVRIKTSAKFYDDTICEIIRKLDIEEGEEFHNAIALNTGNHIREALVAKSCIDGAWYKCIMPKIYYANLDFQNENLFFIMEYLTPERHSHLDCIEGGAGYGKETWSENDIKICLKDIARFHAQYLGHLDLLPSKLRDSLHDGIKLFANQEKHIMLSSKLAAQRVPGIWRAQVNVTVQHIACNLMEIVREMRSYMQTYIHYDLNPRNCCMTKNPRGLCLYDWEVSCIHVPQRDVAEFIMFSVSEDATICQIEEFVEFYRHSLEEELKNLGTNPQTIDRVIDPEVFRRLFDYCVMEVLASRSLIYTDVQIAWSCPLLFLSRFVNVPHRYLEHAMSKYF